MKGRPVIKRRQDSLITVARTALSLVSWPEQTLQVKQKRDPSGGMIIMQTVMVVSACTEVLMLNFPLICQPCRNALFRLLAGTGCVRSCAPCATEAESGQEPLSIN